MEEILKELQEKYENLYITEHGIWIRWYYEGNNYRDGESLNYAIKDFNNIDHIALAEFNQAAELAVKDPKSYFFCTVCRHSKPQKELETRIFAGAYCKECADRPSIKSLIQQSKRRGFYE